MRNLILLIVVLLSCKTIYAQEDKVTIKANRIYGDQKKNIIKATGNVEISKSIQTIITDKIEYNKKSGWIKSESRIELIDKDIGNIFAEKVEIKDDFSSGKFKNPILIFNDGSYLKSDQAVRRSLLVTEFKKPLYSICPNEKIAKDYKDSESSSDLITLKTYKTIIDDKENRIKNSHVIVSILDFPILYTPYLSLPGKKMKRQSGFLSPSYTNNSRLGLGIRTPYFINLNDYTNLTISPNIFLSDNQLVVKNRLQQKLKYGDHNTAIEIANNKTQFTNNINIPNRTDAELRYLASSEGRLTLSEEKNINFDILTVGDKDYLRDFNFDFIPYTQSNINYEYVNNRDYLKISTIRFQELENFNNRDQAQWVLPAINHHVQSKPKLINEIYSLTSNATAINRENGMQYRRVSTQPKVAIPFSILGSKLSIEASNQIDHFNIEYNFDNNSPVNQLQKSQSNRTTFASAEWKLPLIKKDDKKVAIIEPKIKYDFIESHKNSALLPNEDSNNSELTINNLFMNDRISGYDRSEEGNRVTYGLNTAIYQNLSRFEFDIGQSYIIKDNNNSNINVSGYNDSKKSNLVGKTSYYYDDIFSMQYNYQLDENNFNNKVNFLTTNLNYKKLSLSNNLLLIRPGLISAQEIYQNTTIASYKFNSRYVISASVTKDLAAKKDLRRRLSIKNDNCCIITELSIAQNNISNLARKDNSINLNIILKEVGF